MARCSVRRSTRPREPPGHRLTTPCSQLRRPVPPAPRALPEQRVRPDRPALLARLETVDFRADPEELVARCVAQKRDLVEQDEFDTGARQLLNLGHTLGHGVEACSGYTVSHGRAVAIGMTLVTRAAVAFGRCPAEVLPRLRRLLERYGLPDATAYSAQALYEKTLSDKKRSGDTISLVVPIAWGASQLVRIPVSELPAWIERGLGL